MRIKILARRNLRMTSGKLAAQCVHAALGLYKLSPQDHFSCVVLEVSDRKFEEKKAALAIVSAPFDFPTPFYIVQDAGFTEVPQGSETCIAFYETDPRTGAFEYLE
jgi:peptidyl-tRNA hydrolase